MATPRTNLGSASKSQIVCLARPSIKPQATASVSPVTSTWEASASTPVLPTNKLSMGDASAGVGSSSSPTHAGSAPQALLQAKIRPPASAQVPPRSSTSANFFVKGAPPTHLPVMIRRLALAIQAINRVVLVACSQ